MIEYLALGTRNEVVGSQHATLVAALDAAAVDLAIGVRTPAAILVEGTRFDIEMILALLDQRQERQRGA